MAKESHGRGMDNRMQVDYEFVVIGLLARQRLSISIQYSKKQFKAETVEAFINNFQKEIEHIIAYCTSRDVKEITPSDLTYNELSIDTIESISAMFDD
jgi:non-ribosomal peptide synthase protein (TIGR01720 family)